MINQKLQDFEEEVKPLGDIMTQVQYFLKGTKCHALVHFRVY